MASSDGLALPHLFSPRRAGRAHHTDAVRVGSITGGSRLGSFHRSHGSSTFLSFLPLKALYPMWTAITAWLFTLHSPSRTSFWDVGFSNVWREDTYEWHDLLNQLPHSVQLRKNRSQSSRQHL